MNSAPSSASADAHGRQILAALLGLYLLVLWPIVRADRYYNDDLKRALIGRAGWDSNGRHLTTGLMKLAQARSHALVDIAPLTQIGAILILACAGVLIARRYRISSPWMAALAAFPLGAQPFFLENLSYRFDALSMALAVFLAALPILVPGRGRRGWWLGVLALFACLWLYQPAVTVFPVFAALGLALSLIEARAARPIARQLALQTAQFCLASSVYLATIGTHITGWVRVNGAPIRSENWTQHALANLAELGGFIHGSFQSRWWQLYGSLLLLLAAFCVLAMLRHSLRHAHRNGAGETAARILLALALPAIAVLLAVAPLLGMAEPLLVPRVLIGLGALVSASLIAAHAALRVERRAPRWGTAAGALLALGFCVIANAYGNALGAQRAWEERIAARLADDLAAAQARAPLAALVLDGSAGLAPVTEHVATQIPLMRALVQPYLDGDNGFLTPAFLRFFIPSWYPRLLAPDAPARSKLLRYACAQSAESVTANYRLYRLSEVALVRFGARDECVNASATAAAP